MQVFEVADYESEINFQDEISRFIFKIQNSGFNVADVIVTEKVLNLHKIRSCILGITNYK